MDTSKEISPYSAVFENELLQDMIFKHLPFRHLKTARNVSQVWESGILRSIGKRGVIKIYAEHDLAMSIERLQQFISTFENASFYLVRNIKLCNWNFDEIPQDLLMRFWTTFGKRMTNLKISNVIMLGPNFIRQIISQHAPNLQRLVVKNCTFYNPVDEKEFAPMTQNDFNPNKQLKIFEVHQKWTHYKLPLGWNEILNTFPNIKILSVYGLGKNDLDDLFQAMENFRVKHPTKLQLENLTINDKYPGVKGVTGETVNKIFSFNFNLHGLTIAFGRGIVESGFKSLIHQQQHIQQLCLITHNKMSEPIDLPSRANFFPNLKCLELTETMVGTMNFLNSTPRLETLVLSRHSIYSTKPTNLDICATREEFVSISSMKFLHVAFQLTSRETRKLTQWFPQVKHAKLHLDDFNLQVICKYWNRLEELEILGSRLTKIGTESSNTDEMKSSIMDLNRLRKFIMVSRNSIVDDSWLIEGFLQMKSLNHLEIFSEKVTEQGWLQVFQSKQIQTFIPSDGKWPSKCEKFVKILE